MKAFRKFCCCVLSFRVRFGMCARARVAEKPAECVWQLSVENRGMEFMGFKRVSRVSRVYLSLFKAVTARSTLTLTAGTPPKVTPIP